jgi:hypothetical protein
VKAEDRKNKLADMMVRQHGTKHPLRVPSWFFVFLLDGDVCNLGESDCTELLLRTARRGMVSDMGYPNQAAAGVEEGLEAQTRLKWRRAAIFWLFFGRCA